MAPEEERTVRASREAKGGVRGRRFVLAAVCLCALLVPLAAGAERPAGAFVPTALADAAQANPDAAFDVIVQGAGSQSSAGVAANVHASMDALPGNAVGIRRRFASITGVAAKLTGKQILQLAK